MHVHGIPIGDVLTVVVCHFRCGFVSRIRSALDGMLKALDQQVGKTLVSTNPQNLSRPEEEVLGYVCGGKMCVGMYMCV